MRSSVILIATLACSGSSKPVPGADSERDAPTRFIVDRVTLLGLDAGDRGCSVQVRRDGGEDETFDGMRALCAGGGDDATGLIGQRVVLTVEHRDDIDAVMTITPAP